MPSKLLSFLKVLGALAVPIVIGYLFFYSQKMADTEVESFKKEKKANPDTASTTVSNYQLKEVNDSNEVRWQLVAKEGILAPSKDVALSEVRVEYFDGKKLKMRLSAPTGSANESTRLVKLSSSDKQQVIAEGEEGKSRLEASKVELNKNNQFTATGGVNILWPGVAKVTGDHASGSLDKGAQLEKIKIVGNTHALLGHM